MARLIHPLGDLPMSIQEIDIEGTSLRIWGKMGVWSAQILLSPGEVRDMVRFVLRPQVMRYMLLLPWRLQRNRAPARIGGRDT